MNIFSLLGKTIAIVAVSIGSLFNIHPSTIVVGEAASTTLSLATSATSTELVDINPASSTKDRGDVISKITSILTPSEPPTVKPTGAAEVPSSSGSSQAAVIEDKATSTSKSMYTPYACNGIYYAVKSGYRFVCPDDGTAPYYASNSGNGSPCPSGEHYHSGQCYADPNTTVVPAAWVDIKAYGIDGPVTVPANTRSIPVSWKSSTNTTDCYLPGDHLDSSVGYDVLTQVTPPIARITIECNALEGNVVVQNAASDTVTILFSN